MNLSSNTTLKGTSSNCVCFFGVTLCSHGTPQNILGFSFSSPAFDASPMHFFIFEACEKARQLAPALALLRESREKPRELPSPGAGLGWGWGSGGLHWLRGVQGVRKGLFRALLHMRSSFDHFFEHVILTFHMFCSVKVCKTGICRWWQQSRREDNPG